MDICNSIPSVAPYLLPLFIVELNKKYPHLYIKVHEMITEDLVHALRKETIDVAIIVTPVSYKQIETHPLYYEDIAVYVSPEHPYYLLDEIPQNRLHGDEMWMLQEGNCFRSQSLNLCSDHSQSGRAVNFHLQPDRSRH